MEEHTPQAAAELVALNPTGITQHVIITMTEYFIKGGGGFADLTKYADVIESDEGRYAFARSVIDEDDYLAAHAPEMSLYLSRNKESFLKMDTLPSILTGLPQSVWMQLLSTFDAPSRDRLLVGMADTYIHNEDTAGALATLGQDQGSGEKGNIQAV
jgi:hypothetical protein